MPVLIQALCSQVFLFSFCVQYRIDQDRFFASAFLAVVCLEDFQLLEFTQTLPVSDAFRLPAGGSVTVYVSAPTPTRMSAIMWHSLRQGKLVPFYAMLQFQRVDEQFAAGHSLTPVSLFSRLQQALTPGASPVDKPPGFIGFSDRIAKIFDMSISYCLSQGELSPTSVDLGKAGYLSSWKPVPFEIEYVRLSSC